MICYLKQNQQFKRCFFKRPENVFGAKKLPEANCTSVSCNLGEICRFRKSFGY